MLWWSVYVPGNEIPRRPTALLGMTQRLGKGELFVPSPYRVGLGPTESRLSTQSEVRVKYSWKTLAGILGAG